MSDIPVQLLTKGLEEEVYTGTLEGDIVGMAHHAKQELEGFTTEPDCRNTEFITPPLREYEDVGCTMIAMRRRLRDWLTAKGPYTLIPGASMSLGDSSAFQPSDRTNPYYNYIEQTYGTNVVTASIHINMGLDDAETIMRAVRVLRMEACMYLALSASSPFLDGKATGFHSTRWAIFPHTPVRVPLFESQAAYAAFVEQCLTDGRMQNSRHLWVSARANGQRVPYELNRVELRICDRMDDPYRIAAVVGLMEARLWQVIADPALDPLTQSELPASSRAEDLLTLAMDNDDAAATSSLDATVRHWRDGRRIPMRQWIEQTYAEALITARRHNFDHHLSPILDTLQNGNTAQRWLQRHASGQSVRQIIRHAILEMEQAEGRHVERVC